VLLGLAFLDRVGLHVGDFLKDLLRRVEEDLPLSLTEAGVKAAIG
jgi:hypothetical protein